MRYYVEAYDVDDRQILGNLDGQRSWEGRDYLRTQWYKQLPYTKTLNNRVYMYRIKRGEQTVKTVMSLTWKAKD